MMRRVHRQTTSVRPWHSENAAWKIDNYTPIHSPDRQDDIDMCINCPLPEEMCHGSGNCYAERDGERARLTSGKRRPRGLFDYDLFIEAHEKGMTREEMARMFKVLPRTIQNWNRKYGITQNKTKRRE
jgi:hypothetical protein